MRLIEAFERGIITEAQKEVYLRKGYYLGDEIGLDDQSAVTPELTNIDFQNKKGTNVATATAEKDAANLGNISMRVAVVEITSDNRGDASIPVLVVAQDHDVFINQVCLKSSEAFNGSLDLGNTGDHSEYIADSEIAHGVVSKPDVLVPAKSPFVPGGTTVRLYLGSNTTGRGKLYVCYTRLD